MDNANRGTVVLGAFLVSIGVIFLVLNLIPGVDIGKTWPVIFFFLAAAFYLPAFLWQGARRGLAGLFIPGSIMLILGLIFVYDVLTSDWASWAYAWLLIPAGVGLGLTLGSTVGGWGRGPSQTGLWIMGVDVGLFALIATLFGGNTAIRTFGPLVIILAGVLILVRVFRK
ncbi:MAG TPA: hypothetical protein VF313_00455 [Anaerolineaceae bacterium]|jgi:hypothetical protein